MITFTDCTSLPAYLIVPGTLDVYLDGILYGRIVPRQGYVSLVCSPDAEGVWKLKRSLPTIEETQRFVTDRFTSK